MKKQITTCTNKYTDEERVGQIKRLLDLYQAFNEKVDSKCGEEFTIYINFEISCRKIY